MRSWLALLLSLGCGPSTGAAGGEGTSGSSTTTDEAARCDAAFDSGLAAGQAIWMQVLERGDESFASGVAIDQDGIAYVAGAFFRASGDTDAWLHAIAPDGQRLWEAEHAGETGLDQRYRELALTPSGELVVVESDAMQFDAETILVVYSVVGYGTDGRLLWRTELTGVVPAAIAVREDGRVIVGGDAGGIPAICEADASGVMSPCDYIPRGDYESMELADIAIDPQDRLYVVGTASPAHGGFDAEWVVVRDAAGSIVRMNVHEHFGARAVAVAADEDGAVVLGTISAIDGSVSRPHLRRYSDRGVELWSYEADIDANVATHRLALDCEGDALILVSEYGPRWLFRVAADGTERARILIDGGRDAAFYDIDTDPFGNLVAVGLEENHDFFAQKFAR